MTAREPLPSAPFEVFRRKRTLESAGERFRSIRCGPNTRAWLKRLYHRVLMVQTAGRGLACHLPHGELIRTLPEYRYLSWNAEEYAAFRAATAPGMTVLDIGANVGAYTLLFGHWVGAAGTVFAFEPAPAAFEGLTRHVRLNHLERVVRPMAAAIGDVERRADFVGTGTAGENRLAWVGARDVPVVSVSMTTIDAFCARDKIVADVIKIDVEGHELAALRGARQTIRERGSSLSLFVEMHPSIWPTVGCSRTEILEELRAQNLDIVPLTAGADPWAVEGVCVRLAGR